MSAANIHELDYTASGSESKGGEEIKFWQIGKKLAKWNQKRKLSNNESKSGNGIDQGFKAVDPKTYNEDHSLSSDSGSTSMSFVKSYSTRVSPATTRSHLLIRHPLSGSGDNFISIGQGRHSRQSSGVSTGSDNSYSGSSRSISGHNPGQGRVSLSSMYPAPSHHRQTSCPEGDSVEVMIWDDHSSSDTDLRSKRYVPALPTVPPTPTEVNDDGSGKTFVMGNFGNDS